MFSPRSVAGPIAGSLLALASAMPASASDVPDVVAPLAGGVFAMSNETTGNQIVSYARFDNGRLALVGSFPTGGDGAAFDGGEGLDPLISAYSLVRAGDFLLAVNAGSSTVSALRINPDLTLDVTGTAPTGGVGPNSIAYSNGIVYVSNIDADGVFTGEPDQEGSLAGFRLGDDGSLTPLRGSTRDLGNRPAAVQFSPDGRFLVVSSINAGSSALASGSADELVVYAIRPNGQLTQQPISAGSSTLPNNAEGRNLPSAIGFEIVENDGRQFVVVTEAREFQPDGSPPAFPALQTGSVSTWELQGNGALRPIRLDALAGNSFTDGQRTACWIEFSADESIFWVSNALESTLSTFAFNNGRIRMIEEVSAAGAGPVDGDPFGTTDGWIDLWVSEDGRFLYQLFGLDGTIGVFEVTDSGLQPIQEVSDLPDANTQGIVAF